MSNLLLFGSIVLIFAAAVIGAAAVNGLRNPFANTSDIVISLVYLLGVVPALLVGANYLNNTRWNYCPTLEPIATEPDLVGTIEVGAQAFVLDELKPLTEAEQKALANGLFEIQHRLEVANNEINLKTAALAKASETIRTLQIQADAYQKQLDQHRAKIKTLESTRIKCPTPVPLAIQARYGD